MSTETQPTETAPPAGEGRPATFAEEALRLGGKGAEEVRRTGAVDAADDQVESLFAAKYRTEASPIHRAVWDRAVPADLWAVEPTPPTPEVESVMRDSLDVVRRHHEAGTLVGADGKIAEGVLGDLAGAGYWGLLVDREYGGAGAPFSRFAPFLTRMATLDPTVA